VRWSSINSYRLLYLLHGTTYRLLCEITCSASAAVVAATVWKLEGDGYILLEESHGLANVRLPWLNALSFRTRQSSAILMSVEVGIGSSRYPLVIKVRTADEYAYATVMMNITANK